MHESFARIMFTFTIDTTDAQISYDSSVMENTDHLLVCF